MEQRLGSDTQALEALGVAVRAAWSKGGYDFVALDVSERLAITDMFLMVSGRSERNTKAIADAVEDALHLHGVKLARKEGKADGRWILLDFGFLIVHVFMDEERAYYSLERLWKDCPVIPVSVPEGQAPAD